jgi:hypothetical protein
VKKEEDKK